MRKTLILLLTTLFSTASAQPFVPDANIQTNAMPESIWPHQPPPRIPPLATPAETANGLLTSFWTPNLSQQNPNSPQPAASASCAKWVWSGSDNTGWQCTAKPAQTLTQTTQQPPATATCTLILTNIRCTADGQRGGIGGVNGQGACLILNAHTAVIINTGQAVTCTAYN